MNRLALFSFYNKSGTVNAYVYYYIEQLSKAADVVFIANGSLSPDSIRALEKRGCQVCVRDNKGFDFGAWKDFMFSHDSHFFSRYDELILCNSSCYGPVYPFHAIFDEMERRSCDFWGLYRNPGSHDRKRSIPSHIQSYFLVIREKLFSHPCFREYFSGLGYAADWDGAVLQEVSFSAYFEDRGFVSSSYLGSPLSEYIEDPTILMPSELLERRFPLIKRKCFTADYSYINKISSSVQVRNLISFLLTKTDYPADLIYEDLLRTEKNSDLIKALGLSFVLESDGGTDRSAECSCSIAAVLCSSLAERIPSNINYLKSLPDGASIFIYAATEEISAAWTAEKSLLGKYRIEIRLQNNGMCEEVAPWIAFSDVISSFDYICLLNDWKTPSADSPLKDCFISDHCLSGLLFSKRYVQNIIQLFQRHDRLGLLMSFLPMFAEWPDRVLNEEWGGLLESGKRMYSIFKLSVPFDDHPVAPFGGMLWLRSRAMQTFTRSKLINDDVQLLGTGVKKSVPGDALVRMYPMIVQESGFFSGCICPSELTGCQYAGLYQNLLKYSSVKINRDSVHFADVRKILWFYLKRKLHIH